VGDVCDICPMDYDPLQEDSEQANKGGPDGVGDACDNCANCYNPSQANGDGDNRGDACEQGCTPEP
jgi:hypothetical protein